MPNYPQDAIIRHFFNRGQPLTVAKGDVVLGNDLPDGVYYIDTGFIKVYSISDEGDEYLHIIFGQGELFPLIWAYLDMEPQSLYYEAVSECTLWRVSREWFTTYIKRDVELGYALSCQLAQQFRMYSDRIDNLEYKKASERVIYRLLFLAGRFGKHDSTNKTIAIEAPITHELFANSINLARESVSRELERLERAGLIRRDNHHITILDIDSLANLLTRPISLSNWHLQ